MKKSLIIMFVLMLSSTVFAQKNKHETPRDSILCSIDDAVRSYTFKQENFGRYKIYPTENVHILLKLDTATGIIKMVQWDLDREKEFEVYLNSEDLSYDLYREKGRFELYPTKNVYQFILLDTVIGTTWHVQWGTKEGNYWIRRISLF